MSLSSHFSIQIQNNCVIMNVDTNQHRSLSLPEWWFSMLIIRSFYVCCCCFHSKILRHGFMHAYLRIIRHHYSCVCMCFAWIIEFHNVVLRCWIRFYLFTWLNKFIIIEAIVCARALSLILHLEHIHRETDGHIDQERMSIRQSSDGEVHSIGRLNCRTLSFNLIFNLIISTIAYAVNGL